MDIKKFRKFTKFLDTLFKILCVLCVITLIGFILAFIFKKENLTILDPTVSFPIFSSGSHDVPESVRFLGNFIVATISMIIYAYMFYKGSNLFSNLSRGETPFSDKNYKLLKNLGVVLIAVNLLIPVLYSALITFLMPAGYYIVMGLNSEVVIGLVIYAMAEIIRYGVTLQEFSDDTV